MEMSRFGEGLGVWWQPHLCHIYTALHFYDDAAAGKEYSKTLRVKIFSGRKTRLEG